MKVHIGFKNVSKIYQTGDAKTFALDKASFIVDEGEFCAIVGPSGAGKTTILNILGGIDRCTSGDVMINDKLISKINDERLTAYRRNYVGFVFQFYNLVQNLTALENVELASEICKNSLNPKEVLASVDLADRMNNFPSQLSGGEQQRVAIARALAKNPKLLLCDEPTGALDDKTGIQILNVLQKANTESGMTVIVITHNLAITQIAQKIITVRNGGIEGIYRNLNPMKAEDLVL
jgi:putative ABC transport system ATP-binding protein